MGDTNLTILETIGAELEISLIARDRAESLGIANGREVIATHDASTETPARQRNSITFFGNTSVLSGPTSGVTVGTELVTIPLSREQLKEQLTRICTLLIKCGETERSRRSAYHVHIGFPRELVSMQNALRFALRFDSLFLHLAGMGYTYRGVHNHSIYSRPWEAPAVTTASDGDLYHIASAERAIKAKSQEEFWAALGLPQDGNFGKYHPVRYMTLNLFSIVLHHTLEFRYFNKSLNSGYLCAIAELCQSVAEMLVITPPAVLEAAPIQSCFELNDSVRSLDALLGLLSKNFRYRLGSSTVEQLQKILHESPPTVLKSKKVMTHLSRQYTHPRNMTFPELQVSASSVEQSGFVDIHNIRNGTLLGDID